MDKLKQKRKTRFLILVVIISCAVLAVVGIMCYGKYRMGKIPELTFTEALSYTTKDNPDACITVGIVRDGQLSYKVYGENGKELPAQLYTYEIGSLTKTFTAALINKAVSEGKIKMDDTIDRHLTLPDGKEYPTIQELLTHTSGYKGYYFESPMISNFFQGRNDFYGITKEMVLDRAGSLDMEGEDYDFAYSNYGYAVLGLVLEAVYDTDYTALVNDFVQNNLGLTNTGISDPSNDLELTDTGISDPSNDLEPAGTGILDKSGDLEPTGTGILDQNGDLGNYWDWKTKDAYLSAGALTSDISDMLSYARMQLEDNPYFNECHKSLATINASTEAYKTMGIHMDEIGMAWIIDRENGIIWHNGGTGNYNCYLGFHPETQTAIVVLSNLAPNERIPATVLGIKLLTELTQ